MKTDKTYCMSQYLAFRYIADETVNFYDGVTHTVYKKHGNVTPVRTPDDMEHIIRDTIDSFYIPGKTGIFLSGGMDSALLASYLPKGTPAYTFKCLAQDAIDETPRAALYAKKQQLDLRIVEMHWEDFEAMTPEICRQDGVPFHSIEVQLLKAARQAREDGITNIIIGNSADPVFGGMDKLLAKDWLLEEFARRYIFLDPAIVLKHHCPVFDRFEEYRLEFGKIDFLRFMDEVYFIESNTSYMHAFSIANVTYCDPYLSMRMAEPLDLTRIRNGESKYMIRELFSKRYAGVPIPEKIPMPRAMDQWLADWKGPQRPEFLENCVVDMTGDQKWLCWCLEQYLDTMEKSF